MSDQSPNKGGVTSDVIFFTPQLVKLARSKKSFAAEYALSLHSHAF